LFDLVALVGVESRFFSSSAAAEVALGARASVPVEPLPLSASTADCFPLKGRELRGLPVLFMILFTSTFLGFLLAEPTGPGDLGGSLALALTSLVTTSSDFL